MSNRELLKRVISGGDVRHGVTRFYSVYNGERRLMLEQQSGDDLEVDVYCTDLKQLELQQNNKRE